MVPKAIVCSFLLDLVKPVVFWLVRSPVSSIAMLSRVWCPRVRRVLDAGIVTVPSVAFKWKRL